MRIQLIWKVKLRRSSDDEGMAVAQKIFLKLGHHEYQTLP